MQEIVIITPVKKVGNIPYIYSSIAASASVKMRIHWALIFLEEDKKDCELWTTKFMRNRNEDLHIACHLYKGETDDKLFIVRNWMLGIMEENNELYDMEAWVYFLDDNNILHKRMIETLAEHPFLDGATIALFNQVDKHNREVVKFGNVVELQLGNVELSMAAIRSEQLRGMRFQEYASSPASVFLRKVFDNNSNLVWCQGASVFGNYLE